MWCKDVVVHLLGSGSVVLWLHYEEVSVECGVRVLWYTSWGVVVCGVLVTLW